jgi:hypothetical protein
VLIDDSRQVSESMAFHKASSTEQTFLDSHRAHGVSFVGDEAFFLFESNDNPGRGYDIVGKILRLSVDAETDAMPLSFDLYPSPASSVATLRFVLNTSIHVQIRLYDLLGRQVRMLDAGLMTEGGHFLDIPLEGLAEGTYLCTLTAGETVMRPLIHVR